MSGAMVDIDVVLSHMTLALYAAMVASQPIRAVCVMVLCLATIWMYDAAASLKSWHAWQTHAACTGRSEQLVGLVGLVGLYGLVDLYGLVWLVWLVGARLLFVPAC